MNGPFFFRAAEVFKVSLGQVHWKRGSLILDMEDPVIDATGLRALSAVVRQNRSEGMQVVRCNLQPGPAIESSALGTLVGPRELDLTFSGALQAIGHTGEHPTDT